MKKSAASLVSSLLLCALCPLMLFHSAYVTEGAKNGLLLWYSFVVPALFPFMVLSGLIVSGGGIGILTAPFHLVLGPLLGLSKPGVYVLLAGFFCGCPMGAKTCADFLHEGRITENEARFLATIRVPCSCWVTSGRFFPGRHPFFPSFSPCTGRFFSSSPSPWFSIPDVKENGTVPAGFCGLRPPRQATRRS